MPTLTGLDLCARDGFARFRRKSIGVVCNQASISVELRHAIDLLLPHHLSGALELRAVFGPQHGLYGHTQDNMIEWEGRRDERTGLPIYSLYGEHREPTPEMLDGVEELVVDLQDVGARYYTFVWTMAHCMRACASRGIPITVLDRPNPIGGTLVEGTVQEPGFESFVGLYPLPMRHGMTVGEVATHLASVHFPTVKLAVVRMEGWERAMSFQDTGLPWAVPSPNMPTADTSLVYPGGCLLEATWLSEGRGTTRPFEIVGAPFIRPWELCESLNELGLPGVYFRPLEFEPTFQKHAKTVCGGAFVHVTNSDEFEPVLAYLALMQGVRRLYGDRFEWRPGPYEYEFEKLPIDILAGNAWLRRAIDELEPIDQIRLRMRAECDAFEPFRKEAALY